MMNILVTGAYGFVGKNLVEALKNIRDNKDRTHPELHIENIFCYGKKDSLSDLRTYCQNADFVFHLAGVNRPVDNKEFSEVNAGLTNTLLNILTTENNNCPIMLSSSIQASLEGRYAASEYGKSKLDAERLLFKYAEENNAKVFVYRFPNLFGKWCKPNYNSVIATFCHNIANDLPIAINDRNTELELLYIDDLVQAMVQLLEGKTEHCSYEGTKVIPDDQGTFCYISKTHRVTLGEIADALYSFRAQQKTLLLPEISQGSFAYKLYSTYLSYLPKASVASALVKHADVRGSFTELLKTNSHGQISVNVSLPGITKGQHWHNSKWEIFIVVAGHGLIQMRKIGTNEVLSFDVTGDKPEAVYILPGYTHSITNLSETENLVTVMWANEIFDPEHPDTYFEEV